MNIKKNECFVSVTLQESDWINIIYPAIITIEHGLYLKDKEAVDTILEVCNQLPSGDLVIWDEDVHRFKFYSK